MRHLTLVAGFVGLVTLSGDVPAEPPDGGPMATIEKFIDSFNKGDVAGAASTYAADTDLAIIDEIAPYFWHGPQAFQDWSRDLESDANRRGITEQTVSIREPVREQVSGDRAYVVVPTQYTFHVGDGGIGVAAQIVFALRRDPEGWRIHGCAWTRPQAAARKR